MPGHFTHLYTARRVADWLEEQEVFNPLDRGDGAPDLGVGIDGLTPQRCGELMKKWPKFTNVGAIGPDLFFFCQDYSSGPLAATEFQDDTLMLAMAVYYFVDAAKNDDWEPLLLLLAEVDNTFANIVRLLIKLKKLWDKFIEIWKATIGPIVDTAAEILDDLTGGIVSAAQEAVGELLTGLLKIAEEEAFTFADVFSWFSLKMRQGWDEKSFLWSDMLHYRRTNQMARNLFAEARRQHAETGDDDRLEQFQAFALGWVCHLGTDIIDHSFVNEQCGGPFRTHWQRHHLIENHIDAWNYRQAGPGGGLPTDPIAATDTYPDVGRSAMVFQVALDEEHPNGWERPATLPDDPAEAKKAVDQDGEMPDWLADGIVRALIATYHDGTDVEPANLGGQAFQDGIGGFKNAVETLLNAADVSIDRPVDELIAMVAPTPDFTVPHGYPLPWEVKTSYRFMISYYRLSFWTGFDLNKPRRPQFIIWPPASDFTDLASAPDFSGASSGDPVEDVCNALKAIFDWIKKEVEAAIKLFGDIVKALLSPGTYPIRWALYQAAMYGWDMISTAHDMLAHTGFVYPHGDAFYDDGELELANEIDKALIQLGNTVDDAFLQALADATDPFGNLDRDPALIGGPRNPRAEPYPWLPVRPHQLKGKGDDPNEFRRPWAFPDHSRRPEGALYPTPGEVSDIGAELDRILTDPKTRDAIVNRLGREAGTVSGPYPAGATPDQVMFRTAGTIDAGERSRYETARSPAHTDLINADVIGRSPDVDHSPLGDPIPFSAYLMGRILGNTPYPVDFNLDADRGYGYRCWDWIRGDATAKNGRGQPYQRPKVEPEGSDAWPGAAPDAIQDPVQLEYLDPPGVFEGPKLDAVAEEAGGGR
jgi:hypothetical protein